jgi:hypothetical protein
MTTQLVKVYTVMELQGGKEAHILRLWEVAAMGAQAKDNNVLLRCIEEELNANMKTMAIQNMETHTSICTICVRFLSSI